MCLRFSQEVFEYLAQSTDTSKSVPVVFAIDELFILKGIQSRTNGKVSSFNSVKVPKSHVNKDVLARIEGI